jgi:hypothetical protein
MKPCREHPYCPGKTNVLLPCVSRVFFFFFFFFFFWATSAINFYYTAKETDRKFLPSAGETESLSRVFWSNHMCTPWDTFLEYTQNATMVSATRGRECMYIGVLINTLEFNSSILQFHFHFSICYILFLLTLKIPWLWFRKKHSKIVTSSANCVNSYFEFIFLRLNCSILLWTIKIMCAKVSINLTT